MKHQIAFLMGLMLLMGTAGCGTEITHINGVPVAVWLACPDLSHTSAQDTAAAQLLFDLTREAKRAGQERSDALLGLLGNVCEADADADAISINACFQCMQGVVDAVY